MYIKRHIAKTPQNNVFLERVKRTLLSAYYVIRKCDIFLKNGTVITNCQHI